MRQPRPGRCVARIERDRVLEGFGGAPPSVKTRLVVKSVAADQVTAVRVRIRRAPLLRGGRLPGEKLHLKRRHDRPGDLLLDGEDVREVAVE